VVLLPPFPFGRRIWSANAPAIVAAGFRVITLDYPGFGPTASPAAPSDVAIAAIAVSTAALLDARGVARATLLGISMGGYVALAFAALFPERLSALVLADTRASGDTPAARQGRAQALDTLGSRGVDAYLTQSLPRLLDAAASPAMLAATRALAEQRPEALASGIAALRDRPDRAADAHRITCPTLVLVGAGDQVTPPAEMRALATAIAGARFVELPGAGHLTNLEVPEAFNREVVTFLGALPRTVAGEGSS